MNNKRIKTEDLKGMTFVAFDVSDDEILIENDKGDKFRYFHYQSCCEDVSIDDVEGDLKDLLNTPILQCSEEESSEDKLKPSNDVESFTWTFYKFSTIKGYVTIKWYGESNGYYSESVDLEQVI